MNTLGKLLQSMLQFQFDDLEVTADQRALLQQLATEKDAEVSCIVIRIFISFQLTLIAESVF